MNLSMTGKQQTQGSGHRRLAAALALLLLLFATALPARTLLVLTDKDSLLAERFLEHALPETPELRVVREDHWPVEVDADLVMTVGSLMLSKVPANTGRPVIAAFLPLASVPAGLRHAPGYTILPLDPAPPRFIQELKQGLPHIQRVGFVAYTELERDFKAYLDSAREQGLQAEGVSLAQTPLTAMLRGQRPDAIVILPDPALYRRKLIYQIMLNSFRKQIPAIGTTQNMYRAGAALSIFVSPEDCGLRARELLQQWLQHDRLPEGIQYSHRLSILRNRRVMDILGIGAESP